MTPARSADIRFVNPRLRTLTCAGSLAALALSAPVAVATSTPPATIVHFTDGVIPTGEPRNVAAGPDGNVWFTYGKDGGKLGKVTPRGVVTSVTGDIPGNSGPFDLVAGQDGNVWVTAQDSHEILRITPATGAVTRFLAGLPLSAPTGIASGPDGSIWFTYTGLGGGIGRITPSGVITAQAIGLTLFKTPTDITAGPDGNMWFTLKDRPAIGRITPAGVITEFTTGLSAGNAPEQITAGPDGNLWATLQGDPGYIARITPTGEITRYSEGLPANAKPTGIASANGRIWFTVRDGERIGVLDPSDGDIDMVATLTAGTKPNGMATGPDGNVWFVGRDFKARVSRVGILAPEVGTATVTARGSTEATISVPVNPNGQATSWYLQYGRTSFTSFGGFGSVSSSSSAPETVTVRLSGLRANSDYRFRLVAWNAAGQDTGATGTFSTKAASASDPPPTAGGGAGDPPVTPGEQPVIGRAVIADPVAGTVTIRLPGANADLPLGDAGGQLPVGTQIDTRRGTIRLKTAVRGGTQTGDFWGGRFTVRQAKGAGVVTLVTDRTPLACGPTVYRPPTELTPMLGAVTAKKKPRRILWGKDNKGRFRTQGHDSVATVRGTRWATIETCAGTVTKVVEGAVSVRDLRAKRTVLVRAGHSYLARRKK